MCAQELHCHGFNWATVRIDTGHKQNSSEGYIYYLELNKMDNTAEMSTIAYKDCHRKKKEMRDSRPAASSFARALFRAFQSMPWH